MQYQKIRMRRVRDARAWLVMTLIGLALLCAAALLPEGDLKSVIGVTGIVVAFTASLVIDMRGQK